MHLLFLVLWLLGITPIIAFIYFYPHFSNSLLMPGLPWIITVRGSMIMLAMFFKRNLNAISKIGGIGSISSISGISSNSESKTGIKVREDYQ